MARPPLKRVEELFHRALLLGPAERPAFLDEACAGDLTLRAAVEELLRHDADEADADTFLASPLAEEAERLRQESPTRPGPGDSGPDGAGPLPSIPGYEVLEERGRGGMGVVYKARQISLNRLVALKMLLPGAADAPEALARFRAEAEALARLHYPNVVPIHEVGEHDGRPYFTMDYIAGPNLAEFLGGRPQDAAACAGLVEDLARAVHAVHQAGIVHRDLKPANVLLADGFRRALITDFGLARDQAASRKLTRSGMALGTPCYMAPEQARPRGSTVGPAADVHALGAILYEMLTGRPPFDGETPAETITHLLHDEPLSPARLRPRLPRDLVTICLKCLEKEPRRRYASALDLAEDLRRFRAGEPIAARPVGRAERAYRWCRRRPLTAALLALCGLLTAALVTAVVVYEARLNAALARKVEEERQDLVRLHEDDGVHALEQEDTTTAVIEFTVLLELEGKGPLEGVHRTQIAAALRETPELLAVWTSEDPVFREAPLAAAVRTDGNVLAVAGAGGTVLVANLGTGEMRRLVPGRGKALRRLAFAPDRRLRLTEYAGGRVRAWDLGGREPVLRQELSIPGATFAALSDDGHWLFTQDARHRGEVRDVETGRTTVRALELAHGVQKGAVSADGRRLALVGADGALTVWDVPAARPLGRPVPLAADLDQVALGPGGERVATVGGAQAARVLQVRAGEVQAAWSRLDRAATPARFSPDGRFLLLGEGADTARVWDAVTGQAVTCPLRPGGRLAWAGFHDGGPQVVTISTGGVVCFWRMPPRPGDGGAAPGGAAAEGPAVARHETPLTLEDGVTVTGGRVAAGTLRPPRATDRRVEDAVFSPDGRWVAVCEHDDTVRVWDAATGSARSPALRHGGAVLWAAFSPDGGRLLTAGADRTARVWDTATGELLAPPLRHSRAVERAFFRANGDRACVVEEGGSVCTWDLTPDGRSLGELHELVQALAAQRAGRGTGQNNPEKRPAPNARLTR